ncbi:hypothetical protein M9H77_12099 [Catharanthus roseus]|uniref:Uncharacterized protein n=1 Tax=Catharanthus roseus TaxID=4058 RepID=A0ACC0BGD0_CATRO|nr:hypothetical protein M9H77_12099 [Catharanthus roseus]
MSDGRSVSSHARVLFVSFRLNGQSPEPETGSSDKFRHPVVNTSLNSKHIVMSLGVLTRPPCATLAGGPLMTQPARKIRSQTQYRIEPNPPTVLRPLSTGSRSRVTLPSMLFGRGPRTGD